MAALLGLLVAALNWGGAAGAEPLAAGAASCGDYATQAEAQAAADTRDANADGIYCNALPCPCSRPASNSGSGTDSAPKAPAKAKCTRPSAVQEVGFSKTKYPTIRAHFEAAVADGWPQILVVNRPYADARRDGLLRDYETRKGYDRDEYPPAMGRGKYRKALMRGTRPRGWMAHVDYVPSSENQSHGSTMGIKLRRFCNGTKFRYRFY